MALFHLACLNQGLFFPSRGMLALSTASTESTVTRVLQAFDVAFASVSTEAAIAV